MEFEMAPPKRPVWKLSVGEEAPDFELTATGDGAGKGGPTKKVKLSDYRGKKNVVLAFYPAAFTPV
jgi:peroxiredoxin